MREGRMQWQITNEHFTVSTALTSLKILLLFLFSILCLLIWVLYLNNIAADSAFRGWWIRMYESAVLVCSPSRMVGFFLPISSNEPVCMPSSQISWKSKSWDAQNTAIKMATLLNFPFLWEAVRWTAPSSSFCCSMGYPSIAKTIFAFVVVCDVTC